MVVVGVRVAGIVLGKAHGCAEHIDRECDCHQEAVVLEPVRSAILIREEKAECRSKAECNQVCEAIELGSEFGTGVHESSSKAVKLVKKGTQHDKICTHADLVCRTKRVERSGCPTNGKYTQQKVQACKSIWQNKT